MKNLLFLLTLCTALSFLSCNDDDGSTPADFITATIDGNAFEAASITAIADSGLGEELVLIAGTNSDASFSIGLNIPSSTAVNTSNVIDATDFAITFTDANDNAFFTVGEIELSNNDTGADVMEGTFNFTATNDMDSTDVHTITNGAFKVSY